MAAKNVNIYSPGWIFFFVFFLVLNIYIIIHHNFHNKITQRVKAQKPTGQLKTGKQELKSQEDYIGTGEGKELLANAVPIN